MASIASTLRLSILRTEQSMSRKSRRGSIRRGPVTFQKVDLAAEYGDIFAIDVDPACCRRSSSASVQYLGVVAMPSLTLTEKYGRGSQRWLLLHAALIVAGHGVVAAAVLLDELYLHGVLLNASNSIAVVSLCGAAAVLGTLSLLVHAILPADMSVAEFLWMLARLRLNLNWLFLFVVGASMLAHLGLVVAVYWRDFQSLGLPDTLCAVVLLGIFYCFLLPSVVTRHFPLDLERPETHRDRYRKRAVLFCLFWLLRINVLLSVTSAFRSWGVARWLCSYQLGCMAMFVPWWYALMCGPSHLHFFDAGFAWIESYVILKLPAFFAEGLGFWCLGPFRSAFAPADACTVSHRSIHGSAAFCDVAFLGLLLAIVLRFTPLTTAPTRASACSRVPSKPSWEVPHTKNSVTGDPDRQNAHRGSRLTSASGNTGSSPVPTATARGVAAAISDATVKAGATTSLHGRGMRAPSDGSTRGAKQKREGDDPSFKRLLSRVGSTVTFIETSDVPFAAAPNGGALEGDICHGVAAQVQEPEARVRITE